MDARSLQHCVFFLIFCLFILSDPCLAMKPPLKAIHSSNKLDNQENEITFISPESVEQLDADFGNVPIVNPTIPGMNPTSPATNPPFLNPTTPPPPMATDPYFNPTTSPPPPPMTTGPITNPTPTPTLTPTPTPTTTTPASGGGSWCIASPTALETALQVALDYACGFGGSDCSAIQSGSSCFEPNTLRDHASYAFNSYYQKNPAPTSCAFGGTAQLTYTDPSHGNCRFSSSTTTPTTPPPSPLTTTPTTTPIMPLTPPSTMTPINPYAPGGGGQTGYGSEPTDYGAEPTGTPSAAKSISDCIPLLSTMTCFVLVVVAGNYL